VELIAIGDQIAEHYFRAPELTAALDARTHTREEA
jgi:hypothetical protein